MHIPIGQHHHLRTAHFVDEIRVGNEPESDSHPRITLTASLIVPAGVGSSGLPTNLMHSPRTVDSEKATEESMVMPLIELIRREGR